jgi:hypothetical protein
MLDRHSKVGPVELSRKWNIGSEMVKATLGMKTQHGVPTAVHPMSRWLRVDRLHLHRPRLKGTWYLDTLIAKVKWLLGNKCANVFTNGKYTKVVPITSQKEAAESLIDFTDDVGIPETLVTDGATEFTGKHTDFIKQARRMQIKLHTAEQERKNQNHAAEREIGFLSKCWKLRMQKKNVYSRLWDYGLVYEGELLTRTSCGNDGRSGYEQVTGKTPNISEWLDFEFYDLVWWWDRPNKPNINDETKRLGRWLGVSHRVGSDLCYWIITDSGQVVLKTSVEHVTHDDYLNKDTKAKVKEFEKKLGERLDDSNFILQGEDNVNLKMLQDVDD